MSDDLASVRLKKIFSVLSSHRFLVQYLLLFVTILLSVALRFKNLPILKDVTTGKYIPVSPDDFLLLRYIKEVLAQGFLSPFDTLRYVPLGYEQIGEFSFFAHFIASLYRILHTFFSSFTVEFVHVIHPPLMFGLSLIFFYLLVRRLTDWRIANLSTALLAFSPAYLFRTVAGYADKESLAMFFMFGALYFYVIGLQSSSYRNRILFGALSGFFTTFMGLTWGGVSQLFFILGLFAFLELVFGRMQKESFSLFVSWFVFGIFMYVLLDPSTGFTSLFYSTTTLPVLFTLLGYFILNFLQKRNFLSLHDSIKKYLPLNLFYLFVSGFALVLLLFLVLGYSGVVAKINQIFFQLISPFAGSRWAITVAESRQPFIVDWLDQFKIPSSFPLFKVFLFEHLFFIAFMFGSIFLVYYLFSFLKRYRVHLTLAYTLFLFAFVFSRYSSSSQLNGTNTLSLVLYVGSLILFAFFLLFGYLYLYHKEKEIFSSFHSTDLLHLLLLVWFVSLIIAARSAIRLLFVFAPITCILAAYFFFVLFDKAKKISSAQWRVVSLVFLFFLFLYPVYGHYTLVSGQSSYIGSVYSTSWQLGMQWVRDNTPEDAVFAHWWDYGYLVQTGGERATVSDGGNARAAINHFTGRYLLTAFNDTDALSFLYSNNASHVLIISDEIGKYTAFSSIGSDAFYDRFSYIPSFSLAPSLTQERRNTTLFTYEGQFVLDEDFVYDGSVYAQGASAVIGVQLPLLIDQETGSLRGFEQPHIALVSQSQQKDLSLHCLFLNGRKYFFDTYDFDACFQVLPYLNSDGSGNTLGGGLFLSSRIYPTFFARHYLFNEASEEFELVYDNSQQFPLAFYQGQLIGPLKIWKVHYPSDMKDNPVLRGTILPDPRVDRI